jgi:prolyl-tRNA synthetase
MVHSDDQGFVCPPRVAPLQVVGIPIYKTDDDKQTVLSAFENLQQRFRLIDKFSFRVDARDNLSPGFKFNDWELKGIPLRLEIGPKDLANESCILARRDTGEKINVPLDKLEERIPEVLDSIQHSLFRKAQEFQRQHIYFVDTYDSFKNEIEQKPGFYVVYFAGTPEDEEKIKEETKATSRCIAFSFQEDSIGKCFYTGKETSQRVIFAKAY